MIEQQGKIFAIAVVANAVSLAIGVLLERVQSLAMTNTVFAAPLGTEMAHDGLLPVVVLLMAGGARRQCAHILLLMQLVEDAVVVVDDQGLRDCLQLVYQFLLGVDARRHRDYVVLHLLLDSG